MIARPLTRRTVMAGGLLGTAALSGCSVSDLTSRKQDDPEAADRARLTQARDLSLQLTTALSGSAVAAFRKLHDEQIAVFTRAAGVKAPSPAPATSVVTADTLREREQALAKSLRTLALGAERGDVAALLASAAAGIDQELAR